MGKLVTPNPHSVLEDTLWALLHHSHVTLDFPSLNLTQGLAKLQEHGLNKHPNAIKVNCSIYIL